MDVAGLLQKWWWRSRRDSNPRDGSPSAPLAGVCLRPLGHSSAASFSDGWPKGQERMASVVKWTQATTTESCQGEVRRGRTSGIRACSGLPKHSTACKTIRTFILLKRGVRTWLDVVRFAIQFAFRRQIRGPSEHNRPIRGFPAGHSLDAFGHLPFQIMKDRFRIPRGRGLRQHFGRKSDANAVDGPARFHRRRRASGRPALKTSKSLPVSVCERAGLRTAQPSRTCLRVDQLAILAAQSIKPS